MVKTFSSVINGRVCSGEILYNAVNPFDQSVVEENSFATKQMVEQAVSSARTALKKWCKTPLSDRAGILRKAAGLIIAEQGNSGNLARSEIMNLIVTEMGKSIYEAEIEIFESSDILNYYANEGVKFLLPQQPTLDQNLWATKTSKIVFEPVGVIGVIKPWNYPLEIPLWTIGAALLAGNTIVFKPSEITSGVGCFIEKVFREAGLPPGVLNVLLGDGVVGEYLVDANIDMVSFTGSNTIGKTIYAKCSKKMIKCSLELGGKDAFIVCDDADIERAANGAVWGAFANAGQVCVSGERFFVHSSIYNKFIERVVEITRSLKLGSGFDVDVDIAPLAFEKQFIKVKRLVDDAITKGANILIGGKPLDRKGFFFEPTIIENITSDMLIEKEELFGPIMPIYKFSTIDEVVNLTNNSEFGLGASVWSRDKEKAVQIASEIEVGMVWINDVNVALPQCPWGGVKQSGIGNDLSQFGIYEYSTIKHICIENSSNQSQPWWYPYKKT
jgi:succinate-semialdehyde dehydrogenase/glutarate-semialdehyde dehydrogenase